MMIDPKQPHEMEAQIVVVRWIKEDFCKLRTNDKKHSVAHRPTIGEVIIPNEESQKLRKM